MQNVKNDIYYVGVNDHKIDLFEGQYIVPNGMSYNSYIIIDEKTALFDTVDKKFTHEWLDNVEKALAGRKLDYLIVQHMEPDHSANIINLLKVYPNTIVVGNSKTFKMIEQFFHTDIQNKLVVNDLDTLSLGKHTLTFVFAPMVHWPEVMVTYDSFDKCLFSADAFGKFGALDVNEEWAGEARRYYFGIVGKYGLQVQKLLARAKTLDIQMILPLHGNILMKNLAYYIGLYEVWSSYESESEGVMIAYTSVYGNTFHAVSELEKRLYELGAPKVVVCDLARSDMAEAVEDAFRYNKLVLATTTYNASIFPFMNTFIESLVERNFQNKTIGIIENGTWAIQAGKVMKEKLKNSKNLNFLEHEVRILSSLSKENYEQLDQLALELTKEYKKLNSNKVNKNDLSALMNIEYGLYVVTSNDGKKDNGLIVNTVSQVTSDPLKIAVTINKQNYSHHIIQQTGIMNVNCLTVDAPFKVFESFGFVSGRNVDKFKDLEVKRSSNNLVVLPRYINAYMSLRVVDYVDLGTHGMFICAVNEIVKISSSESMTYSYYLNNVKPKPVEKQKGYVCKICGYVYENDVLPEDFICPLCKHGASDFEKIE